tara:strand:- start:44 stop:646 length:603 start_codon:yes stop_codon:yes gene_type:complete
MEYIYEMPNMLPKTLCQEMIEKFESDYRKRPGELQSGAINPEVKKCTDLSIEAITGWGTQTTRINHAFNEAFVGYQNYLKLNIFGEEKADIVDNLFSGKNVVRNTFTFRKYQVGDYFKWHIDYGHSVDRICNFIIYLNDHEACTEFLNGKKIKPEAGKIVFFPTTWVHAHCGQTIEKGNKYMVTGFIHYDDTNERYVPLL